VLPEWSHSRRRSAESVASTAYFGHGNNQFGILQIVDRADTGMHVLEVTGEARQIANLK
jgi:hypothetical protein